MPLIGKTSSAKLLSTKLGGVVPSDPFALAFAGFTADVVNATTFTFSAHALGAAAVGTRYSIITVGCTATAAQTVSTLTVGGLSAALVVSYSGSNSAAEIWIVDTSSLGTTADVVITWSAAVAGMGAGVYRMVNPVSSTATATATASHTLGVSTLTLDIPTGGFAVAVVQCRETVLPTYTWTGTAVPTENYDADTDTADAMSGAISTAAGAGLTFIATSTDTTPAFQHAAAASWGP